MNLSIPIPADAANQRLDQYLSAALAAEHDGLSRSRIQSLISEGKILLDGAATKPSLKLRGGETVTITGPLIPPPLSARPEKIPLDIIHQDTDIAVINKPAGMMVHAGSGLNDESRSDGTLVNALLARYKNLSTLGGPLRPGIVHRLDKETSGLIIVAKNDRAHARLSEMFSAREMHKTYIALVHGNVERDNATINTPIGRDVQRRTRMTAKPGDNARTAITHYSVLKRIQTRFGKFTLVKVKIETGRTHQIRVHMASINHPVVGDTLYGAAGRITELQTAPNTPRNPDSLALDRNFLHAAELEFAHPRTGKPIRLTAPLPSELESFIKQLETKRKQK